uniref:Inhibitor of growth protein N-terminal histone-binding domain-containing protein n=1 Tax=Meloidogyne floridensis TaxID=298350 RepID=A0A915NKZ8_9BILA
AFPNQDPRDYPILNYSFEPAEGGKNNAEEDNALHPFNETSLLGFLPAEMKKKCAELRELDFQYQAKMEKLGVDSEQLIEAYPTLTATESEKKNKELEQVFTFISCLNGFLIFMVL